MIAIKYVVLLMLAALLLCLVVIGWSDYRQRRLLKKPAETRRHGRM